MPSRKARADRPRSARGKPVSALQRGLAVLRCFEERAAPLSHGELARLTGIPKPSLTRLVATLVAQGFLRLAPESEHYLLGSAVVTLARSFLASFDMRTYARPHMMALAEDIGGWSYLGARNGLEMVLIETCRSRSAVLRSRLDVGSRVPLANSALGRAYLGALGARERNDVLRQIRRSQPDEWPHLHAGIRRALLDFERRGYSASLGEWHPDVNSIAVPLRAPDGELMALNWGGPAFAFPAAHIHKAVAPKLVHTARAIAQDIGGIALGSHAARAD